MAYYESHCYDTPSGGKLSDKALCWLLDFFVACSLYRSTLQLWYVNKPLRLSQSKPWTMRNEESKDKKEARAEDRHAFYTHILFLIWSKSHTSPQWCFVFASGCQSARMQTGNVQNRLHHHSLIAECSLSLEATAPMHADRIAQFQPWEVRAQSYQQAVASIWNAIQTALSLQKNILSTQYKLLSAFRKTFFFSTLVPSERPVMKCAACYLRHQDFADEWVHRLNTSGRKYPRIKIILTHFQLPAMLAENVLPVVQTTGSCYSRQPTHSTIVISDKANWSWIGNSWAGENKKSNLSE